MKFRTLMMVGVALLDLTFVTARLHAAQDARFDTKVRNDFFAGFAGDKAALERGMKACESVLAADPKAAEALVWHGSGLMYLSGQAFQSGDQTKGMDLFIRGQEEMDRAVNLEPDNVAVLIPRGATLLQVTLFMPGNPQSKPLLEKGLTDYLKTLDLQKTYFGNLGEHPRGQLLFGIADANARLGNAAEAARYFERIKAELPGTEYASRADTWLNTKTLTRDQEMCIGCHVASNSKPGEKQ